MTSLNSCLHRRVPTSTASFLAGLLVLGAGSGCARDGPATADRSAKTKSLETGESINGKSTEDAHGMADLGSRVTSVYRDYDDLGIHRTGTDGDQKVAVWLESEIRALGLAPTLQSFTIDRLEPLKAWVEIGDQRIEGVPLFDASGLAQTAPGEARLELRGRLGTFFERDPTLIGFGVVGPHRALAPAFWSERERPRDQGSPQLAHLLVAPGVAIGMPDGLALNNAEHFSSPGGPPALQLPSTALSVLEAAAASGTEGMLRLHSRRVTTEVHNVLTTVAGIEPNLSPIVVFTPRSGWWHSVAERGGGLVVWLELQRHLVAKPPRRSVHFVATTGHELGHVGFDNYLGSLASLAALSQRTSDVASAVTIPTALWIHLGANFGSIGSEVRLQTSDTELRAAALEALSRVGEVPQVETPPGTRPFGEARNIFDGGGRFVSLLGSNVWFHHPADRWPRSVDVDRTIRLARAFVELIDDLANAP